MFTRRRVAVFVDGCSWHACPEHGREPTRNEWYWSPKLRENVARDTAANEALHAAGWRVVRIWEHEAVESAIGSIVVALDGTDD